MVRQRMKLPKDQALEPEDVRPSATGTTTTSRGTGFR